MIFPDQSLRLWTISFTNGSSLQPCRGICFIALPAVAYRPALYIAQRSRRYAVRFSSRLSSCLAYHLSLAICFTGLQKPLVPCGSPAFLYFYAMTSSISFLCFLSVFLSSLLIAFPFFVYFLHSKGWLAMVLLRISISS